jgi:hypothetical protein
MRQVYKEGFIQQGVQHGREVAMKDMINKSIQEAFMSTDPKMVELQSQMLRLAGVQVPGS